MTSANPWEKYQFSEGQALFWHLGPLELFIKASPHDWRIFYKHDLDPLLIHEEFNPNADLPENTNTYQIERYVTADPYSSLQLSPLLSDIPVVARPELTLKVPPKESTIIYVSTPLWIKATYDKNHPLFELPVFRLSDTWFGPNPTDGELCYSIKTAARINLSELPVRTYRAITEVRIINKSSQTMTVDRVKIPLQYFSLFKNNQTNLFYTDNLIFEKDKDEEFQARILPASKQEAGKNIKIAPPRVSLKDNLILNKLKAFLT